MSAVHVFNAWLKRKTTLHPDRIMLRVPFHIAIHCPCRCMGVVRDPERDRSTEPFEIVKYHDGTWHHRDCIDRPLEPTQHGWWVLGEIYA